MRTNAPEIVAKALVALIGRPNVGKSTLYNRLSPKGSPTPRALVHPLPGVTRDVLPTIAHLPPLPPFVLLDAPGVDAAHPDPLAPWRQTPDILLFLLDGAAGVTPEDRQLANNLRRAPARLGASGHPQLLLPVVNKCDLAASSAAVIESYSLGLGDPVLISAAHGSGMVDLAAAMQPAMTLSDNHHYQDENQSAASEVLPVDGDAESNNEQASPQAVEEEKSQRRRINFAILGRPNVGKSTLANALAGRAISLTSEHAGTTRDVVIAEAEDKTVDRAAEAAIVLLDTAGLRRKARVLATRGTSSDLERMSASAAVTALRRSSVVGLVLDAQSPMTLQDAKIGLLAISEGKPVAVIVNKWDKIPREEVVATSKTIQVRVNHLLSAIAPVPIVYLSALRTERTRPYQLLLSKVRSLARRTRARHASTRRLSIFIKDFMVRVPAPGTPRPSFGLMTQTHASPPSFVLFGSWQSPSEAWERALRRSLRQALDLRGVPIRFSYRGSTRSLQRRRDAAAKRN